MDTLFDLSLKKDYKSRSQIARVLTESWVSKQMFCPICGNLHLNHFENNQPVGDFFCEKCKSEFELKSKNGKLGRTIADGAYESMISRFTANNNPDFMFMSYSMSDACVTNVLFVPKFFLTPSVIEKRKPLSQTARRAGWVGCNIHFHKIPEQGRIPIVVDGIAQCKEKILQAVQKSVALQTNNIDTRGWLFDVLNCINKITKNEFSLEEVYKFESYLQMLHPLNNNIRAKIRQQLQLLRDRGIIDFYGNGKYHKNS